MRILFYFLTASVLLMSACNNGQAQNTNLSAKEFSEKIKELAGSPLIDVRTPEEFSAGHLENALNYNWNGDDFENQISTLDKTKPVLVYCLSGGRSGAAASKMRSLGFTTVYELKGGIMAWRSAALPETTNATSNKGMSMEQYQTLLNSDKIVLVDFYAEWCAPCKKMKPYLEEISKDLADKVVVIRIDADQNKELCSALKIEGLPVLKIYKNKVETWSNMGFIEKSEVLKKLGI